MRLYNNLLIGDWLLILILLILFSTGLLILYSSTIISDYDFKNFFLKQFFGIISGLILSFFISRYSYKKIINWGSFFHIITIFLLLLTLLKGSISLGAKRWISLGFFKFQPSELAKITLPIWICNNFSKNILEEFKTKNWINIILMIFFTGILILKQPDLGSAIVICLSGFLMLYIAGIPKKILIFFFIFSGISFPFIWKFVLHDYQKKRISIFLGEGSLRKERYQIEQSKIAIGSGGLNGKGFLQGTQKNLKFLPENRTDFICAVLAEEFGFIGTSFILILYVLIILRLQIQSYFIDEIYGYILSCGIMLPFIVSTIINMMMVVGLLPIVGIPLPCISYGISHIWSTCFSIGILNSILKEKIES